MFRIEVFDSDSVGNDKSLGWVEVDLTLFSSGLKNKWLKLQVSMRLTCRAHCKPAQVDVTVYDTGYSS
jgi:hypothetical protein